MLKVLVAESSSNFSWVIGTTDQIPAHTLWLQQRKRQVQLTLSVLVKVHFSALLAIIANKIAFQ